MSMECTRISEDTENFLKRVRDGALGDVATLLKDSPSLVHTVEAGGYTALHFAAYNGDIGMIQLLLDFKPKVDAENYDGNTPLMLSAKVRQHGAIEVLQKAGANVNFKATSGATAAHFAASMGHVDTVRFLVRTLGATYRFPSNRQGTLLHWAAHSGSTECLGAMMYEFANGVDEGDEHGGTALFTAIFMKRDSATQFLLEHGANPNAVVEGDKSTPLHAAAEFGTVDIIRLLMTFGAETSARNSEGLTPIDIAKKGDPSRQLVIVNELQKAQRSPAARMEEATRLKAHGNKVFGEGETVKAARFYTLAIHLDPKNHVLFSNRAACKYAQQNFEAALYDAERCVRLAPTWSRGYFRKGTSLLAMGRLEDAQAVCSEGLRVDSTSTELKHLEGDIQSAIDKQQPRKR